MSNKNKSQEPDRLLELHFEDSDVLQDIVGENGSFLTQIEKALAVEISHVDNVLKILGTNQSTILAQETIDGLRHRAQKDLPITDKEVTAAIRIASSKGDVDTKERAFKLFQDKGDQKLKTRRKHISPRSPTQAAYLDAIDHYELVFGVGPAGTGKTYLAVAKAVELLMTKKIKRIIITRPAVEAGENLGFLPGDLQEKIDPYLRPVYDALHDMLPAEQVIKYMADGLIEVAPLAFMRGRTLNDACVVLDEAQNTSPMQMKMFLTRLGEKSRMIVCGDISQTDLPREQISGLKHAIQLLQDDKDIGIIRFKSEDVVRHPLVAKVINAYDMEKK